MAILLLFKALFLQGAGPAEIESWQLAAFYLVFFNSAFSKTTAKVKTNVPSACCCI
jgi:hypothetical protein